MPRRVIKRSKSCQIPVLYCHKSQFDFITRNFEAVSSKQTNKFYNAHNLLCILCNVPILPTEELHGPHNSFMNFYVQNLPFRGWETNITSHPSLSLSLSIYIYICVCVWMCVCVCVYIYIYILHTIYTYIYICMLHHSHFLCKNSNYTHLL